MSSTWLNDSDHPIIEKNDDMKPNHPSKTVPVWRLKQKNPSRTTADDGEGILGVFFISVNCEF